jgi:hypothetical protein
LASSKKPRAVRHSVAIPAPLAKEVLRLAKQRRLTVSRALVALAEKGAQAERDAKRNLKLAYGRFLAETDSAKKGKAGKDLIRAVLGRDAMAEDPVR